MQLIKNIVFLFCGCLILIGCEPGVKETITDPLVYDSRIIGEMAHVNRELFHLLEEMAAANPEQIQLQYDRTVKQIDESLRNTQALTTFNKKSDYKDAAVTLLEFHKGAMNKQYKRIVEISMKIKPTLEEEEERESLFEQMENVEEKLDDRFLNNRQKFGEMNNTELPNDGLQL